MSNKFKLIKVYISVFVLACFVSSNLSGSIYAAEILFDASGDFSKEDHFIDWSEVDFEDEVLLPSDVNDYLDQFDLNEFDEGKISELDIVKRKMWDSEVMDHFNVPIDVRNLVLNYKEDIENEENLDKKFELKKFLANDIRLFQGIEYEPEDVLEIDINDLEKIEPNEIIFGSAGSNLKVDFDSSSVSSENFDHLPLLIDFSGRSKEEEKLSSFFDMFLVYAQDSERFMNYYDGIERINVDLALYDLATSMNLDGSYGENNKYQLTYDLVTLLKSIGLDDNDQYDLMVNYLLNEVPKNNLEKAIKIRVLAGLGLSYEDLLGELSLKQNSNGGFSILDDYSSDLETSLEMLKTFYALEVADERFNEALFYALNQISDDGSIYYTSGSNQSYYLMNKALNDLYYFRNIVISDGENDVAVIEKINLMIDFLNENFDVNENRLLSTSGSLDELMMMNSFDLYGYEFAHYGLLNDKLVEIYNYNSSFGTDTRTEIELVKFLKGPNIDIVSMSPVSDLRNNLSGVFDLEIANNGYEVLNGGKLYLFIDNFYTGLDVDLSDNDFYVPIGGTLNLEVSIPNASYYVGDVDVQFYIETEKELFLEDNWEDQEFAFEADSDKPATHVYNIVTAYENTAGRDGINIRWSKKDDSNRRYNVIAHRLLDEEQFNYSYIASDWNGAFFTGFSHGTYEITSGVLDHNNRVFVSSDITEVIISEDQYNNAGSIDAYLTLDGDDVSGLTLGGYGPRGSTDENGEIYFESLRNGSNAVWIDEEQYERLVSKFTVVPNSVGDRVRVFSRLSEDTEDPVIESFYINGEDDFEINNQAVHSVLISARDDVALKDFDLFYYDSVDDFWSYIGSDEFNGRETLTYDWEVPENLLGSDYMLRLLVRDYRDNEVSSEWGPFEILDGTRPVVTFNNPVEGSEFSLGETMNINWNTESANGILFQELLLIYPNERERIYGSNQDVGSFDFEIENDSMYAGEDLYLEMRSVDAETRVEGFDRSDFFNIVDNSEYDDLVWSRPAKLFSSLDQLCDFEEYLVESDDQNYLHFIFRCQEDIPGNPRIITDRFYYLNMNLEVEFSEPELIYENSTETNNGLDGYRTIRDLEFKLDSDNYVHLAWNESEGSCDAYNDSEIYYLGSDGNQFFHLNLSNNNTRSYDPHIEIDSNDKVNVLWSDGKSYTQNCSSSGQKRFEVAEVDDFELVNSEIITFGYNFNYPQTTMDSNDELNIVYNKLSDLTYDHIKFVNGEFIDAGDALDGAYFDADIDYGLNGELKLIVQQYFDDPDYGNRYRLIYTEFVDGLWSEPLEVSLDGGGFDVQKSDIEVDINGNSHISYIFDRNDGSNYELRYLTKNDLGEFVTSEKISFDSHYVLDPINVKLIGNTVFNIWDAPYSFAQQTFFSKADLDEITFVPDPTIESFTIEKPSVVADSEDEQVIRYVLNDGEQVNAVMFLCNHTWHRVSEDAPKCGYFRWEEGIGFTEYIAGYNEDVELLDTSERIVHEDGRVEFVLRFRYLSGFEGFYENTFSAITYFGDEAITWKPSEDHFEITRDTGVQFDPTIESFTLEKDSVVADSEDEQVIRYVLNDGEQVDAVMFLCNHAWHRVSENAPKCGYFRWEEGIGFTEYISSYNVDVELLDTSERIVHEDGSVEFVLRFKYLSGFEGFSENTFSAITYFGDEAITWTPSEDHFEILEDSNFVPDPTIESFILEEDSVLAGSEDEQVIRYVLNDGEQVNAVMFLCNHAWHRVSEDAPRCGYFRWEEGIGFTEYIGSYNADVELLDTSERIVHEDGRVEFVLRFKYLSGFEGFSENTFSAITYFRDEAITWTPSEDHFEIVSAN